MNSHPFAIFVVKALIAFLLFKVVTRNLNKDNLTEASQLGRWLGGWLMGVSILSNPVLHKSDADIIIGTAIMAIASFAVGFVIGYVWRMYKPANKAINKQNSLNENDEVFWEQASAELNSSNRNEGLWAKCFAESNGDETKAKAQYLSSKVAKLKAEHTYQTPTTTAIKNDKQNYFLYGAIALASVGVFYLFSSTTAFTPTEHTRNITYNVFACKDVLTTSDNCDRELSSTAKITVDKPKQQVTIDLTNIKTNEVKKYLLTDCNVIDGNNWTCGGKVSVLDSSTSEKEVRYKNPTFTMKDGTINTVGYTISNYRNGQLTFSSYKPGVIFVAQ